MKKIIFAMALIFSLSCFVKASVLSEVSFKQVHIEDPFWSPHLEANRMNTVTAIYEQLQKTGRIDNFAKTAGLMNGEFIGAVFNDSDVYKWLEGASYMLAAKPDADLEKKVDDTISKVAAAQQGDGYLNTYFTLKDPNGRWTNIRLQHELYCAGHLFEAAVAHYQATGKRTLLNVAIKYADYIDSVFGWEKRHEVSGHEEVELALVKLYNVTGEKRYLDLAEFFLQLRGTDNGRKRWDTLEVAPGFIINGEYQQDHLPIGQHTKIVGHAVRAMYLYCAVADMLRYSDNPEWSTALNCVWDDMVSRNMYITGGIGSTGGTEGFTQAYDLPNENAYAETCAAVGEAFWGHRLNMLYADAKYADVTERVLYNNVLAGASLESTRFFYTNALASSGNISRSDFFGCACCPPNWMRLMASLGSYIYTFSDDQIYVNLYAGNSAEIPLANGSVKLKQQTRYPWDGNIKITIDTGGTQDFALNLRIPQWCSKYKLSVNQEAIKGPQIVKGYARVVRDWKAGDVIELELDMPIMRVKAHPSLSADKGRVALQRGPLVYCLEGVDNDFDLNMLALPIGTKLSSEFKQDILGGIEILKGQAWVTEPQDWGNNLYKPQNAKEVSFIAVPYFAWCNREKGQMIIWIREYPLENHVK